MGQRHVSHFRLAHLHTPELLEDFDDIEAATFEAVRQINHGHAFEAAPQLTQAQNTHKLYSL